MKMFPPNLRPGSNDSSAIRILQIILLTDNFSGDRVIVNGKYDDVTIHAVKSLQAILDVPRTGELDEVTQKAIKDQWGLDLGTLNTEDFSVPTSVLEPEVDEQELFYKFAFEMD